jgi:hypothetical protein
MRYAPLRRHGRLLTLTERPEGVDQCLLLRVTVTDQKKRRVLAAAS